ncbi:MAG: alpha/beta hydrolase, partial [Erysipelotrichaceae bacterium]|nr:alpha/beta hydrolase [Erysipelotrichaceae bacterium]
ILYLKCLKYHHDRKIILMGDSAGGGLALGLCQYWDTIGLKQPYRLILLSPWVDLTMENPDIPEYEKNDPSLIRDELLVDAYYWADGTDLKDRRLSPIYGDMSIYKRVSLFVGTHEMFYPDITLLARKLEDAGARVDLNIGEGLNHVYPAYPIPEADKALKHIEKLLL